MNEQATKDSNEQCLNDNDVKTNKRSNRMETAKTYYENGNVKEFIITDNGIHIGDGNYSESGEKYEMIWETDNGNTIHKYYGKNGKLERLEEIEPISDDEFKETVRFFNQNDTVGLEIQFKNDLLNGDVITRYENGRLKTIAHMIDDEINGLCIHWDEKGQKIFEIEYQNGELNSSSQSTSGNSIKKSA